MPARLASGGWPCHPILGGVAGRPPYAVGREDEAFPLAYPTDGDVTELPGDRV